MSERTSIPCRVGRCDAGCFIQSPRTGNRIIFTSEISPILPRVWGRIVQKLSIGSLTVEFTREELHAVKAFADVQAEHEANERDAARSIEYRVCLGVICDTRRAQLVDACGSMYVIGDIELLTLTPGIIERLDGSDSHPARFTPAENELLMAVALAWKKRTAYERFRGAGWRGRGLRRGF